jgi:hypothetical protein
MKIRSSYCSVSSIGIPPPTHIEIDLDCFHPGRLTSSASYRIKFARILFVSKLYGTELCAEQDWLLYDIDVGNEAESPGGLAPHTILL